MNIGKINSFAYNYPKLPAKTNFKGGYKDLTNDGDKLGQNS